MGGDEVGVNAPHGAVFLSYASENAEAAARIAKALKTAGIEVWFDKSDLRGGDAWDQKIRRQIRECALFVPLISRNTQARFEGYFRLEWNLAAQRTQLMARSRTFLLPVCVDDTPESAAEVPEPFVGVHWTRLPDGEASTEFVTRVRELLAAKPDTRQQAENAAVCEPPKTIVSSSLAAAFRAHPRRSVLVAFAVLLMIAVAGATWLGLRHESPLDRPGASDSLRRLGIAVLPFADMSEKHDQEYFADGMAEELIDVLGRIPGLKVISRTSSFYFKGRAATITEIARTLGVTHVLEGSVRKAGEQLRVTTELVDAMTGERLWSASYDRELKDVFRVQGEIANAVAAALPIKVDARPQLTSLRAPTNPEAYDQFLLCRQLFYRTGTDELRRAAEACHAAIELDPNYADAYAELALVQNFLGFLEGNMALLQPAYDLAEKAVALGPDHANAYAVRGYLRLSYRYDWSGAESDLAYALALNSRDSAIQHRYALLLQNLGRLQEAIAGERRALELDPLLALAWVGIARSQLAGGDVAAALETVKRALQINPENIYANYLLVNALLAAGRAGDALAVAMKEQSVASLSIAGVAAAEHSLGHADRARAALERLTREHAADAAFQAAAVYAWRGEKEAAFEWLDRAYRQHDRLLSEVKLDPRLKSLRADPRFIAFLSKLGLPE